MPSNWTKQPQYPAAKYLNDTNGDTQLGGAITTLPASVGASQGLQDVPGDRLVLGAADALALSDTSVGTLYCGMYMYVGTNSTSGNSTLGHLMFWDASAFSLSTSTYPTPDNKYQVTPKELQAGTGRVPPIAGICINQVNQGNWWWIQIGGRATASFGPLASSQWGTAGAYIINGGVFAGGYGTTAGTGLVTQVDGDTFPTTALYLSDLVRQYVGVSDVAPSASSNAIISMELKTYRM
jgi:hypothetical protein